MKQNRLEIVALILIVITAAVLRLGSLNWEAFSWNEGTSLGGAIEYAKGNFLYNFNDFATPPLIKYIGALVLYFSGFSEVLLRSISALFGTATVILTFFFAKRFYSSRTALFASAMVALSVIHLTLSRMYQSEVVLGFFFLLSIFAYFSLMEKKNSKFLTITLGAALGLAMLTKYMAVYLFLFLLLHAIATGSIKFSFRKKFSVEIEKYLIKAFLVFLLVFFVIWPFSLYPIKIHADVSVVGFPERHAGVTLNIPEILLSPQEYITTALGRQETAPNMNITSSIVNVPVIGYFTLFASKESLIFPILFIIGIFTAYYYRKKYDMALLSFILLFLILAWVQKYGFTYRYISAMIPFFAVIAARPLDLLKNVKIKYVVAAVTLVVMLVTAIYAFPTYTRYYNQMGDSLDLRAMDGEIQMMDGYREGIGFVLQNCTKVSGMLAGTIKNYVDETGTKIVGNATSADLPLCVYENAGPTLTVDRLVTEGATCSKIHTVYIDGIEMRYIYYCK